MPALVAVGALEVMDATNRYPANLLALPSGEPG